MIDFNSKESLFENGFRGFKSVKELRNDTSIIPNEEGVYLVLNFNLNDTDFLEKGTGGFFKNKDPNVSIEELHKNFVDNSLVVYIGKANSLRRRIKQYLDFGEGKKVGHRGGRYIWQIEHNNELIFCWKVIQNKVPREVEKDLIGAYKKQFGGRRPFANLQD